MITVYTINKAESELNRVAEALKAARRRLRSNEVKDGEPLITGSIETGALRRASMDLTRALAELRRR